jgi:benzoate-CoA ligase family protein
MTPSMTNIADAFLDARVREGRGSRTAVRTDDRSWSYAEIQAHSNRFAHALAAAGVEPEQRVMIALPDGPEFVGALFGTLKVGGVVVMVNPALPRDDVTYLVETSRAKAIVTHRDVAPAFQAAAAASPTRCTVLVVGDEAFDGSLASAPGRFDTFASHRDDPAIWLFSGGTTGRPKAVVQTHRSFSNTTECYAKGVIGYREDDITIAVPKLYFGYATGSNLLFPFSVGASCVLFPEHSTPEALFDRIRRFRPTILIQVPTLISKMVAHVEAKAQDLSCLRLATSAGEALPVELDRRWRGTFGVELLDGLGTAEMWHIFISNRPGAARPGTLGQVVPGFEIQACDEEGREVPAGETGWLRVRGDSRALGYWQNVDKTAQGFRGEWYVTGDLVAIGEDGFVTYGGRGDEMLKVSGKWLAPQEVESCLLQHPAVAEAAVIGMKDSNGLIKPCAFVVAREPTDGLDEKIKSFVRERLEPYKQPRQVVFVDALPRTHLGKVDRGRLRRGE